MAGTHAGLIPAGRVVGGTVTGGGSGILPLIWTWTATNDKAFVLRNANQQIALSGFSAALPGGSLFEIGTAAPAWWNGPKVTLAVAPDSVASGSSVLLISVVASETLHVTRCGVQPSRRT